MDGKDKLIVALAEKLYICSRLLTAAAERLGWDADKVRQLTTELEQSLRRDAHAGVEEE